MNKLNILQAMILGAGLSTRMRPLTNDQAKPMLPFLNATVFDHTLKYLQSFGLQSFCTNVFHAKKNHLNFLKKYKNVTPFVENTLLGTGGGIFNMQSFIHTENFVIINCDFICDIDLNEAFQFHLQHRAMATLVIKDDSNQTKYSPVSIDPKHFIFFGDHLNPKGFFTGIHIVNRELFNFKPKREIFCIIQDVYQPLLKLNQSILGFVSQAPWLDTGELKTYQEAQDYFNSHPKFTWMKGV